MSATEARAESEHATLEAWRANFGAAPRTLPVRRCTLPSAHALHSLVKQCFKVLLIDSNSADHVRLTPVDMCRVAL